MPLNCNFFRLLNDCMKVVIFCDILFLFLWLVYLCDKTILYFYEFNFINCVFQVPNLCVGQKHEHSMNNNIESNLHILN